MENLNSYDFFEKIRRGKTSEFDRINFIENQTNLNPKKLNLLLESFNNYFNKGIDRMNEKFKETTRKEENDPFFIENTSNSDLDKNLPYSNKFEMNVIEVQELNQFKKELKNNLEHSQSKHSDKTDLSNTKANQKIKWQGTQTQFIEIVKSLIENGNIKGKQKDIITILSETLNIEIKNPDKKIQDIKKRSIGSETLFLDDLKTSLYNYIALEKEKK